MIKNIAGTDVDVDDDGYLTDMNAWNGEIAKSIAAELGINELTQQHWDVLNWIRDQASQGVELNIRKVGNSGITDIKQFYVLFPNGPLKNASKIAGLRKPTSCL